MKRIVASAVVLLLVLGSTVFATGEKETKQAAAGREEGPRYGGTLTYPYWSNRDPGTADMHTQPWPAVPFASSTLDYLIAGDFEKYGPRGTGEYNFFVWDELPLRFCKGALAESWEVSPERIVLKIRSGVMWAAYGKEHVMEPRELTAEDVAFSLNRFLDISPATGPPGYLRTENGGWVTSVKATDSRTVVVETSRYDALWVDHLMAGWGTAQYAPEVVEADLSDWTNLVGTGPFMVKEHVPGSAMIFEKNPNYWGTATIDGVTYDDVPFVDELVYPIIADTSTRLAALRTGKVDMHDHIFQQQAEELEKTAPELLYKTYLAQPHRVALNMLDPILARKEVRQALTMATDRWAINKAVYGANGDANTCPVGPMVPDVYTPFDELPKNQQEFLTYNPEKAKKMLADAGYPDGFSLEFVLASDDEDGINIASMMKSYFADVDVDLTLKTMEATAYWNLTEGTGFGAARELNYDLVAILDPCDAPMITLDRQYMPRTSNQANFADEDFQERFAYALTLVDDAKRNAILKELNVEAIESAAYIGIGSPAERICWWPWVKNFYGERSVGNFYQGPILAAVWIDEALKKEMGY